MITWIICFNQSICGNRSPFKLSVATVRCDLQFVMHRPLIRYSYVTVTQIRGIAYQTPQPSAITFQAACINLYHMSCAVGNTRISKGFTQSTYFSWVKTSQVRDLETLRRRHVSNWRCVHDSSSASAPDLTRIHAIYLVRSEHINSKHGRLF